MKPRAAYPGYLGLLLFTALCLAGSNTTGQIMVGRYNFENTNSFGAGKDTSGATNSANCRSSWGTAVDTVSYDAVIGARARQFYGMSCLCWSPPSVTFTNIRNTLAGSFSLAVWVKTDVWRGLNSDHAQNGATILWAFNGGASDLIPLSLTGKYAAFTTRDHLGAIHTLHSSTSVNDNYFHHLAVTRNQTTGEKRIYVDGALDASGFATTDVLNAINDEISIGGTVVSSYIGLIDDLRIYSGVLNETQVAALAADGVRMVDVQQVNDSFYFSFVTQPGRTHTIESSTNLTSGVWTEAINFVGDGAVQQFEFPMAGQPRRYFRVRTQ